MGTFHTLLSKYCFLAELFSDSRIPLVSFESSIARQGSFSQIKTSHDRSSTSLDNATLPAVEVAEI